MHEYLNEIRPPKQRRASGVLTPVMDRKLSIACWTLEKTRAEVVEEAIEEYLERLEQELETVL
jgi:predicted DNA-binding protein